MKLIQNNPYRIVGLLAGATAKEQTRQIKRLKRFIEAEQEPQDDFSFPIFGNLKRTIEKVEEAASRLNLDNDKINAALFWFWNGSPITDEVAFDSLKDGDIDTAIEIWRKYTDGAEEVTQRNASAFHNLSTLYLYKHGINEDTLQLKLRFLESDLVKEFKEKVTDETFKVTKKELQLLFLERLSQDDNFDISDFFDAIADIDFSAKSDFMKGALQKPIDRIEQKIETAKSKRKANNSNAANAGKELYNAVTTEIAQLKSILGTDDIKYTSIADKIADEILQCGIDYFKEYRDSNTDPSSVSMDLFRKAKTLAIGSITKQRIQENSENLQEWIDDKPERDKQKKIADDLKFITSKLERFQNLSDTVSNAKDLVDSCKPKLENIKNTLGSTDDFYLKISGAVANNALGMLITAVNAAQKTIEVKIGKFSELCSVVRSALAVSESIGSFDLIFQQRIHYLENHSALKSIASQLGVSSYASPKPKASSSGGSTDIRPMASSSLSSISTTKEKNNFRGRKLIIELIELAVVAVLEYTISGTFWATGAIIGIAIINRNLNKDKLKTYSSSSLRKKEKNNFLDRELLIELIEISFIAILEYKTSGTFWAVGAFIAFCLLLFINKKITLNYFI